MTASSVEALWARARALRAAGEACGSVLPLAHRTSDFAADGITWNLRVLTGPAPHAPTEPDPFLPPYDEHLYVADLGPRHVLILNKYPVLGEHLLIVTRDALPQAACPDPEDFAATARLLAGAPALAFYNGGPESGASQPHRHFQAVGLPLGPAPAPIPTQAWIEAAAAGAHALPFAGAAALLPPDLWHSETGGETLHAVAAELLGRCGRDPAAPGSFNLLFTRAWMLAVPRRARRFRDVSMNSLGYAGAMIVKSRAGQHALKTLGPAAILRGAAG